MGALLDLLFQAGVGFLQLARHVVELIRQPFELVAGLDRDALRQIAPADARGARLQRLDRADHAAGEKHPGEHGKTERAQEHEAEPLQRRVKRGIGLLGRELDEHQPAERRHRRIGGQHLAPFDVLRFLHRLRHIVARTGAGRAGACGAHLR